VRMTRRLRLAARVNTLEAVVRGATCNCRVDEETLYHTAADLARIMSVRCPVHNQRDLGYMLWLPPSSPLRLEDRELCSCPPCAAREWREGRRGPLTEEEREQEYRSWEEQLSGEAAEQFRRDQARSRQLLQRYLWKRRNQRGTMPGNNKSGKTL
jgi:hypothetical protein